MKQGNSEGTSFRTQLRDVVKSSPNVNRTTRNKFMWLAKHQQEVSELRSQHRDLYMSMFKSQTNMNKTEVNFSPKSG